MAIKTKKENKKVKKDRMKIYPRMTNYPAGDFLVRIKNISKSGKKELVVPKTNLIEEVARCLERAGYLSQVAKEDNFLKIMLAQVKKESVLENVKIISKPGLRIYIGVDDLEKRRSPAILVLSTSKGILTAKEAIKKGVGGEVLAEIF
jgi:small subunit ribosomal protein S8